VSVYLAAFDRLTLTGGTIFYLLLQVFRPDFGPCELCFEGREPIVVELDLAAFN
jgi:hypothetical protein